MRDDDDDEEDDLNEVKIEEKKFIDVIMRMFVCLCLSLYMRLYCVRVSE